MKNYAESVRARLKQIADKEHVRFNYIVTRYLHERFLYRLSKSDYSDHFFLKGGALFFALEGLGARPTKDLDLLGSHISNQPESLKGVFGEILNIGCENDGVLFDVSSLETTEIVKEGNYRGVRIMLNAQLGQIKERVQIDIGFGDVIIPGPMEMEYPTLLDMESPRIQVYSVETMISEKFHAMIVLDEINSRMKDFYDVFVLINKRNIDTDLLKEAIQATFKQRQTLLIEHPGVFEASFGSDAGREAQWTAFLRKSRLEALSFETVHHSLVAVLKPLYDEIRNAG